MLKIESGVKIPPGKDKGRPSEITIALASLRVGQSAFVRGISVHKLGHSAWQWLKKGGGKGSGKKFTSRTVNGGARIWRTK